MTQKDLVELCVSRGDSIADLETRIAELESALREVIDALDEQQGGVSDRLDLALHEALRKLEPK